MNTMKDYHTIQKLHKKGFISEEYYEMRMNEIANDVPSLKEITSSEQTGSRFLVIRPKDKVEVMILQNESDNTFSYVNLTHKHICSCRFASIKDAINDMDKQMIEGRVIRYERID